MEPIVPWSDGRGRHGVSCIRGTNLPTIDRNRSLPAPINTYRCAVGSGQIESRILRHSSERDEHKEDLGQYAGERRQKGEESIVSQHHTTGATTSTRSSNNNVGIFWILSCRARLPQDLEFVLRQGKANGSQMTLLRDSVNPSDLLVNLKRLTLYLPLCIPTISGRQRN